VDAIFSKRGVSNHWVKPLEVEGEVKGNEVSMRCDEQERCSFDREKQYWCDLKRTRSNGEICCSKRNHSGLEGGGESIR